MKQLPVGTTKVELRGFFTFASALTAADIVDVIPWDTTALITFQTPESVAVALSKHGDAIVAGGQTVDGQICRASARETATYKARRGLQQSSIVTSLRQSERRQRRDDGRGSCADGRGRCAGSAISLDEGGGPPPASASRQQSVDTDDTGRICGREISSLKVAGGKVYVGLDELRCYDTSLQREEACLEFLEGGLRLPLMDAWSLAEAVIAYADIRSVDMHMGGDVPFVSIGLTPESMRGTVLQMGAKTFEQYTSSVSREDDYSKSRITVPIDSAALPSMQELLALISSDEHSSASLTGCSNLLGQVPDDCAEDCLKGLRSWRSKGPSGAKSGKTNGSCCAV
jgi:hypothetical protein